MKILKKLGKKIKKEFDKKVFSSVLKKIDDLSLTTLDSRRRNYFFKYNLNDFELKSNEISFVHTPKTGGFSIGSIMLSPFKNNAANIAFRNFIFGWPKVGISNPVCPRFPPSLFPPKHTTPYFCRLGSPNHQRARKSFLFRPNVTPYFSKFGVNLTHPLAYLRS